MVYAGIIIALIGLAWYAIRFYAWLRTIFTVLVILVAMSIHAQPFAKMTGTGAYGGLVTYSPAAQKWDQRTALQWWRLTPSYFRAAVRDSVFALSGDTAALVLGLDPYGQGTPVTIGSGLSLDAGVLTGSGGISGSGTTGYVPYFTGSSEIGNSGLYWDNGNSRLGIGRTPTTYAQETQGKITSYGVSGASGLLLERFSGGAFHILRDDGGNNLGIYAGGAGRVFLAPAAIQTLTAYYNGSAGLVGIGQTSPIARLHVTGSGSTSATTAFLVENASGTDALEVKDNGQVIIGATAGTGVPLEVTSSSSGNIAFFKGKDNTLVYYRAGGVGYNAGFKFQTSNGVTTTGSVTSSTGTGNLEFLSTGNMSFSPATNVGIGQTSPTARLHVTGPGSTSATFNGRGENSSNVATWTSRDDGLFTAQKLSITSTTGPTWTSGTGSPEGVVTAPVGSIYSRTDGGAGTSLYVKESGAGNTGWVGK